MAWFVELGALGGGISLIRFLMFVNRHEACFERDSELVNSNSVINER